MHKTRDNKVIMNWIAGSNTAGGFTAIDDGEIFKIDMTNISSVSIGGTIFSKSYPIAKGGSYYFVPVLINPVFPSTITIYYRKTVETMETINVTDIAGYPGNYLFILSNTKLRKLDTDLLKAGNYLGSGSWSDAPQIASKMLPTFTGGTGTYYNSMCFVKHAGVAGKMLIVGRNVVPYPSYNIGNYYYGFVDVADMSLTNLDGGNDTLTLLNAGQNIPIWGVFYDYVNEYCYVNGNISKHWIFINLLSPSERGSLMQEYKRNTLVQNPSYTRNMYNPNQQSFGRAAIVSLKKPSQVPVLHSVINVLGSVGGLYAADLGRFIVHLDNTSQYFSLIDPSTGATSATFRYNPDAGMGTIVSSVYDSTLKILISAGSSNRVGFYNFKTSTSYNYVVTDGVAAGQTGFTDLMPSKHAGLFFARGIGGDGVKRLYVFDITGNTLTVRYLDFDEEITHLYTNQLLS